MAKAKKIKDLEAQTCFNGPNEIATVTFNRADLQDRNDLHWILQTIWSARRDYILRHNYKYPSLLIVHYKTERDLRELAYNDGFSNSALNGLMPCGPSKKESKVFDLRLIVSGSVEQDEIIIA